MILKKHSLSVTLCSSNLIKTYITCICITGNCPLTFMSFFKNLFFSSFSRRQICHKVGLKYCSQRLHVVRVKLFLVSLSNPPLGYLRCQRLALTLLLLVRVGELLRATPPAAETNEHINMIILLRLTSLAQGQMYVAFGENRLTAYYK